MATLTTGSSKPTPDAIRSILHNRDPRDLHWKPDEEASCGSYKNALDKCFPDWIQHTYCYSCGGEPCPLDHAKEKKIRTKDMDFVRAMLTERNLLVTKVEQLQNKLQDQVKLKADWEREKLLLEAEIERLRNVNDHQLKDIDDSRKMKKQLQTMAKNLTYLEKENATLKSENDKIKMTIAQHEQDLVLLQEERTRLASQLRQAQTQLEKVFFELDDTKHKLRTVNANHKLREEEVEELKSGLETLYKELQSQSEVFSMKELDYTTMIGNLKKFIRDLKHELSHLEILKEEYETEITDYKVEIQRLKDLLKSNSRFRQFVNVKREVVELREKNVDLKEKLKLGAFELGPPLMKSTGRIVVPSLKRAQSAPMRKGNGQFGEMNTTKSLNIEQSDVYAI